MIENLKHNIKEKKTLMKMHCNNMKTLTSIYVFGFKRQKLSLEEMNLEIIIYNYLNLLRILRSI